MKRGAWAAESRWTARSILRLLCSHLSQTDTVLCVARARPAHPHPRAQDLEKELVDSIECLRQAGIILEKYSGPENESAYFDKINEVVAHYGRLYAMRGAAQDPVPIKVMEDYLDKGLNPDLYTKHRLKLADDLNQHNQGRVESLRLLHDHVQREVERRLGPAPVVKRIDPGATAGSDAMQVDAAADCSR